AAADTGRKVVAVGCLAERYGDQLAASLPEADAVLGFDDYPEIGTRLDEVLAGRPLVPHRPRDRRTLLPIAPVERPGRSAPPPGHGSAGRSTAGQGGAGQDEGTPGAVGSAEGMAPRYAGGVLRRRLDGGPVAPLKLASGCDRRCAFCAIP